MSRKGNCYDNCIMETFFGRLKNEMYYGQEKDYASFDIFAKAMEEYIEYYNNERIQAKTKWMPPVKYRTVLVCSTILMSVNYVVWVLAGQFLLAFKARLFPIWGYENWTYLMLPVLIGIISSLGVDVRFYRTAVLDEIYKSYVRTARAKGLSGATILVKHVLRNSLIPIVTFIALAIPHLFTGSLMLETFFGIPGLGNVSLNAIHSADMAVVRALVVLGALLYQGVNLITDLAYAWLDPRVRLG